MAEPVVLDWTDRRHWAKDVAPCIYCGLRTHMRDDQRLPAHKTCAEEAAK